MRCRRAGRAFFLAAKERSGMSVATIPAWLKRTLPTEKDFFVTKSILEKHRLNTICQDAKCPNVWECWSLKTATFLILGDICTRTCGFCSVAKGRPGAVDAQEPQRIAQAEGPLKIYPVSGTKASKGGRFKGLTDHIRLKTSA